MLRRDVKTTGHTVTGETATVDAVLSLPDVNSILEGLFTLYFEMTTDLETDPEAFEQAVAEAFKEMLKEAENTEMNVTFNMVMEDGKWKLTEMPDLDKF
ncbi:MAG: hypothetical protein AB1767_04125 [Bacillota bacterium]